MTIADAEAEERAAIAAIGALGERELIAVKAWVASGCEGPQPKRDDEARRVLADRLMAAIEAREAAEKGSTNDVGGAARMHPRAFDGRDWISRKFGVTQGKRPLNTGAASG